MSEIYADYSQPVTVTELDGALRSAGANGVWHYVHGNNARRVEFPAVVKGMASLGWKQAGIDVPTLDQVDGAAAVAAMAACGLGPGYILALDIEPSEFDAFPNAWPGAADEWCDAVRAAGYRPVVYGTDVTLAACGNHADAIWRAEPGDCDPAGPGIGGLAPGFFAGRRANQCMNGTYNGVELDLSISQFTMSTTGEEMTLTSEEHDALITIRDELLKSALPGSESWYDIWNGMNQMLTAISKQLASLQIPPANLAPVTDALVKLQATLDRIEAGLKGT